jgi:hypothetical protein
MHLIGGFVLGYGIYPIRANFLFCHLRMIGCLNFWIFLAIRKFKMISPTMSQRVEIKKRHELALIFSRMTATI